MGDTERETWRECNGGRSPRDRELSWGWETVNSRRGEAELVCVLATQTARLDNPAKPDRPWPTIRLYRSVTDQTSPRTKPSLFTARSPPMIYDPESGTSNPEPQRPQPVTCEPDRPINCNPEFLNPKPSSDLGPTPRPLKPIIRNPLSPRPISPVASPRPRLKPLTRDPSARDHNQWSRPGLQPMTRTRYPNRNPDPPATRRRQFLRRLFRRLSGDLSGYFPGDQTHRFARFSSENP